MCDYDETQAIGRRYRRQDELGTPYCVTVDFDTLDDRAVTVRERDSMAQDRVADRRSGRLPTRTTRLIGRDVARPSGATDEWLELNRLAWDERVPLHVG